MKKIDNKLAEMLKPGNKIRIFYNKNNRHNQLRHIRAIIDNEYIVYKFWNRHRQSWVYKIEWIYSFIIDFRDDRLTLVK